MKAQTSITLHCYFNLFLLSMMHMYMKSINNTIINNNHDTIIKRSFIELSLIQMSVKWTVLENEGKM